MVAVYGDDHLICFANQAFIALVGVAESLLVGVPFSAAAHLSTDCISDLERVYRTGQVQTRNADDVENDAHTPLLSYAMWPLAASDTSVLGVMIQITESGSFRRQAVAVNEALLLSSLRQHEAATLLNEQLKVEAIERNLALAALIQSEKLASLGRMAAAMAHEINNPLEAVTNTLYLARITPELPEMAKQFLEMADGELQRIAHITRQTLGFYRESSGAERFSVESLIESVVHLLSSRIKSKQAVVRSQVDKGLQMTACFGELRQVFSNLMLNSLDAIERGGTIVIRAKIHPGWGDDSIKVRLSIADNGQGIDPAILPQLFEPFFTTKGSIGNGLGLWVTREIVDKHRGTIRARSHRGGELTGTTFSVLLPQEAA